MPIKQLKAFRRVTLKPGQKKNVELTIPYQDLNLQDATLKPVAPAGIEVFVGGLQGHCLIASENQSAIVK